MADYGSMAKWLMGNWDAPARAYMAQSPNVSFGGGLLGNFLTQAHKAIDPVNSMGGYGGLLGMALPPGAAGEGAGIRAYKGMHPYDAAGNEITTIKRDSPFPAFNHGEEGVNVGGGFYSSDPAVASRFAKGLSEHGGAVYPVDLNFKNPFVIDAAGEKAGNIQFGASGSPFRDAIRSGKHDGVIIKNTADEGDVYVALKRGTVKSAITKETLYGAAGATGGLGALLARALAGQKDPNS